MGPILKRWIDVLSVHAVALFITAVAYLLFLKEMNEYSYWLLRQNTSLRLICIFVASCGLWLLVHQIGGIRFSDIRLNRWRYPSLWAVSVLCGLSIFVIDITLTAQIPNYLLKFALSNLLVFLAALIFIPSKSYFFSPRPKKLFTGQETLHHPVQEIPLDIEELIKWASREEPIANLSHDFFGHKYVAEKIVDVLAEEQNKNVGIIGDFGSGKSSVINLIGSRQKSDMIVCKIEGWGFREQSAVEHILQLTIEELKKHFDCIAISGLPREYHDAMHSSGNHCLATINGIIRRTRNPLTILGNIDNILECLRKRLIIIFEDIDRNIDEQTFYNEIASFLNVTKQLNHISFIIAVRYTNHLESVLTKLCEHNEYVQRVKKEDVIQIAQIVQTMADMFEDLRPNEQPHKPFLSSSIADEDYVLATLNRESPFEHIARLLDTPRGIKAFIRELDTTWTQLHGELDFSSLFLATVCKIAAPEIYCYIDQNISLIRNAYASLNAHSDDLKPTLELLSKRWDATVKDAKWNRESGKQVLYTLFPLLHDDAKYPLTRALSDKTPQGFVDDSATDYWARMNIGRLTSDEYSDQSYLRAVTSWQSDHSNSTFLTHSGESITFARAIYGIAGISSKLEYFHCSFTISEVLELASEVFQIALKDKKSIACEENCPGFKVLWQLSLDKEFDTYDEWLIKEIARAMDVSLHFANDLYFYWRRRTRLSIDAKETTPALKQAVFDLFEKKCRNKPHNLLRILDQGDPVGLWHLVFYKTRVPERCLRWIGGLLLEAAEVNPKMIASYVACLISNSKNGRQLGVSN